MEPSCSDCKMELIEKRWIQLLLKWINKCVSDHIVKRLNPKSLADVMAKYNKDVCTDDIDRAILCTDDVEPFLKYKYPILRLFYLSEESDKPRRLYISTSMILYHCCMNSCSGQVDGDICRELTKFEQELVLRFCENLCEMEATIHNVERAIRGAFETVGFREDVETPSNFDISLSSDTDAHASSESTTKGSMSTLLSDETMVPENLKLPTLKFNSSITVLPSVMADTSTYSDMMRKSDYMVEKENYVNSEEFNVYALENSRKEILKESPRMSNKNSAYIKGKEGQVVVNDNAPVKEREDYQSTEDESIPTDHALSKHKIQDESLKKEQNTLTRDLENLNSPCLSECSCSGPCCGDHGSKPGICKSDHGKKTKQPFSFLKSDCCDKLSKSMKIYIVSVAVLFLVILTVVSVTVPFIGSEKVSRRHSVVAKLVEANNFKITEGHVWRCKNNLCQKAYQPDPNSFASYSRCSLICMGPQLWPYPVGYTFFSKKVVSLSTNKLEYKFQSLPSELVHQYLAEAFKLFIGHLARIENSREHIRNKTVDLSVKKLSIQIDVESDPDPRLRLNSEEAYHLKIETVYEKVVVKISSSSFCGVRNGLETLSQLILNDQSTGKLVTLSHAVVKDAPSYKYRGLMVDTARNYIPVEDLMRTVDAMATVKLNTFHWRISDVTSFPLYLPSLPQLFEYGAYDRAMVYTKEDVKAVVSRAGFRGIRVLIEVAAPGPVGRPWSWSPDVSCPTKNDNFTCDNILCLRMTMRDSLFNILRTIYTEILEMTQVDDVIHLSDGVFSLVNCFYLMEDRDGFLDKILAILQEANKGFIPKLPIVWFTPHLMRDYEAKAWDRLGVQLNDVDQDVNDNYLSKFKVIHSSKWDLSCEMKKYRCRKYRTWQEMYSWKSWRNIEVFTIEGGEAVLWTDLVNSANLDAHLWPRAAAVAERLWSDAVVNVTVGELVYVRLDSQRRRMLFHGIDVQPVWPVWCSFNPGVCLEKLHERRK